MPYTAADAKKYKKGLSPKQAKQWAAVANSVLQRCLKDGGTEKTCAGKAITQASGVVGKPANPPKSNTLLTVNTALTVQPQRLRQNEQDYLIAPCVMLVAGVLNEGLVINEALVPTEWNGVPVVIGHPQGPDGSPVSARDPSVLSQCGIGHVFHARLSQGQRGGYPVASLLGDLWINLADVARCGADAQQVIARLEHQDLVECSTAFYPIVDATAGVFVDGTPFVERYLRLSPDHLALLPNAVGACSLEHGCGVPRLNHQSCACGTDVCTCGEGPQPMNAPQTTRLQRLWQMMRDFVHHEEEHAVVVQDLATNQTDIDIREALQTALLDEAEDEGEGNGQDMGMYGHGSSYMSCPRINDIDVANQTFTYYDDGRLQQRSWTVEGGVITLGPEGQDVQRNTTYTVVPDAPGDDDALDEGESPTTAQEETPMAARPTIQARVDALIQNPRRRYTDLDRDRLLTLDEAMLIVLEQQPLAPEPVTPPPPREGYLSLDEALQSVAPEDRDLIHVGMLRERRRKDLMVQQLAEVKDSPYTADELQAMGVERLEKLTSLAGLTLPGQAQSPLTANYNGRRMPPLRIVQTDETEAPPPPPDTMSLVVEERKRMGLM